MWNRGLHLLAQPRRLVHQRPRGVHLLCAGRLRDGRVAQLLWDGTQEINCNGVTPGQGAVEERRYESGYVTLSGVPPAGGWYFTFHGLLSPSSDHQPDLLIELVHAPCLHVPLFHQRGAPEREPLL